jgi:hypothetical protein
LWEHHVDGQGHTRFDTGIDTPRARDEPFNLSKYRSGITEQTLASRGEDGAVRASVKEFDLQEFLEIGNSVANGALGSPQSTPGCREPASVDGRYKYAKLLKSYG